MSTKALINDVCSVMGRSGIYQLMTSAAYEYSIRLARVGEEVRLREIEDAAGEMFSGLGLIDEALDGSFPSDLLEHLIGLGQVWAACDANGIAIGMVIASVRDDEVYVEEMDVMPEHGRRGIGSRLLETVCTWAAHNDMSAVTLSTFRGVPWNGPFYRKHAFVDLEPQEWSDYMHAIREREREHGLRTEQRVFMRRVLREAD